MYATNVTLLVVLALFGVAVGSPMHSSEEALDYESPARVNFEKNRADCAKKLGLTTEDLKGADPKPHQKVLACVFKIDGVMTEDGKFSAEGMIKNASEILKDEPERLARVKLLAMECNKTLADVEMGEEMMAKKISQCFHEYKRTHPTSA